MSSHPDWRPRLVATDLDGTLVRADGSVSDRTRAVLAAVAAAGVPFVVVTGRPRRWLTNLGRELGVSGTAIAANGALLVDLDTLAVLHRRLLAPGPALQLVSALRAEVPGVAFAAEYGEGEPDFGYELDYRPRWPTESARRASAEELLDRPVVKLLARSDVHDADALLIAGHRLSARIAVTLTHSSRDGLLEISAKGVDKATTLEHVATGLGVAAADVLAFGDMPNDAPMLAWAGRGLAVANAHPAARMAADGVCGNPDDDGVATELERYFASG